MPSKKHMVRFHQCHKERCLDSGDNSSIFMSTYRPLRPGLVYSRPGSVLYLTITMLKKSTPLSATAACRRHGGFSDKHQSKRQYLSARLPYLVLHGGDKALVEVLLAREDINLNIPGTVEKLIAEHSICYQLKVMNIRICKWRIYQWCLNSMVD